MNVFIAIMLFVVFIWMCVFV